MLDIADLSRLFLSWEGSMYLQIDLPHDLLIRSSHTIYRSQSIRCSGIVEIPTTKIICMMLSKYWRSVLLSTSIVSGLLLISTPQVFAATEISEEKLNTEKSLTWGAQGLPFDDVVTVRDALVNSVVGKLVIDRHGEDNGPEQSTGLLSGLFNAVAIRDPFAGPNPGRLTIVTLWGSKEEGCFVKAMIHNAPKSNSENAKNFVPTKMEVGVGDRVVKLTPATKSVSRTASGTYNYTKDKSELTAPFYFAENTFAINAKVADLLRNAPAGDAKVRITFANGESKVFPIGSKNVARWRDTYGYNPNCKSTN
jgi:hypothetical protein